MKDDARPRRILERVSNSLGRFFLSSVRSILRPVSRGPTVFDESSLQGAGEFASTQWVVARALGMGGFILLTLGFLGVYLRLRETEVERWLFRALVIFWIGRV